MRRFDYVPENSPLYPRMKEASLQQGPRGFRDYVPERDLAAREGISDKAAGFHDKRSTELECQFCQKVCKGLGGLKAHIRSNHVKEHEEMVRLESEERARRIAGGEDEESTSPVGENPYLPEGYDPEKQPELPEPEEGEEEEEAEEDEDDPDGNPNSDCPEGV